MSDTPVPALPNHPAAAEPVPVHDGGAEVGHPRDAEEYPAASVPAAPDPAADLRAALDGAAAGFVAVGLGLGAALAPVLVAVLAEAFGGGFTDPGDILRTAGQIWLAAQRVGLDVAGEQPGAAVRLGIVPLGVTVPLVLVLARAGRRCAAAGEGGRTGGARPVTFALSAFAIVYAGLAYGIAVVAATPAIEPVRERAPIAAGAAALVFGGYGALRMGAYRDLPGRMPPGVRDRLRPFAVPGAVALRAGAAAACVLAAGGAVIVCASLVVHADAVGAYVDRVAAGAPDTVALALLCAALMPNAVMCAVAYASGAGFAIGVGTTVAPTGVDLGAVPALPLLGALPETTSVAGWCTLAVPVAAGVVAGLIAARGGQAGRVWTAVGAAAASGAVTGVLVAGAAWLATGAAGAQRLTRTGPHIGTTAGSVTAAVAVVAALTALIAAWYRRRTVRAAAHLETVAVPVPGQATR
ncbi:cell division protein PerM [Yinghuangia sp. YIM S09857]|uniref:cell division protein PerM n=1 Tax=Yinghuangia sp. YIM S09857 TaxID=3436929 RepID=UPI003F5295CA